VTDDVEKPDDSLQEEASSGPVCGERLAEARRELQIPVLEIAKELHLDEYKVRALESNDFDVIGAPVFAKGHLRKFAQLVRISEADVMADYYELTRSSESQPALSLRPRQKQALSLSPGPWLALIIVAIVIGAAYWWFVVRPVAPDEPASSSLAPLPQQSQELEDDGFVDVPGEATADDELQEPAVPDAAEQNEVDASAGEPSATPAPATSTDANTLQLQISYSGECWTEISDARGERLFFDLGRAGRTVNLAGEAPFNVLFGNAANVSVRVNGADYPLPAPDGRGTARLTILGP
tara:strand:- start:18220 stop:19104 length:885 start_codon:yes stop_codon:yes gene_type:complete